MKTHKFDALSFLAGLVITGIGLAFLLLPDIDGIVDFLLDAGTWFWPVLFIAVGIAVLAPLASRNRTEQADPQSSEDTAH